MIETKVCFVRHGQTDWNLNGFIQGRENNPLNKIGIQQARDTARFLQSERWDIVISSPLIRAYDTAKETAKAVGLSSILLDSRFIERDFGEISGCEAMVYLEAPENQQWVGFETDQEIQFRVWEGMQQVLHDYTGKRVIVVAHSHAIKAFLTQIAPKQVQMRSKFQNACSSFVLHTGEKWILERFNVSDHITVL